MEYFLIAITVLSAFSIALFLVPKVSLLGKKYQLIDIPDSRKIHKKPKVIIGGLAILASFVCVYLVLVCFNILNLNFNSIYGISVLGIIFYSVLGLLDDIYNLSPFQRLIPQFLFASFSWACGIRLDIIQFPSIFGVNYQIHLLPILSLIITLIWLVGVANAINWIDGIDGLASGYSVICSLSIIFISYTLGLYELTLISSALLGSCLGFYFYNSSPSSIHMGDCGSNLLGFGLAQYSLILISSPNGNINFFIPILLLFVPILDMIYVIFRRLLNLKSPFYPDKNHFHHKLLNIVNDHKYTTLAYLAISQFFIFLAFYINQKNNYNSFLIISIITTIFSILYIRKKSKQ